jgi:hypothetical protein
MKRAWIVLLISAGAAAAQDVDILTRPALIHVERIHGNMTPVDRVFFHIVIHNLSSQPVTVNSLRFEMLNENGANLSGTYAGRALMQLFDSAIERRRIEPTPRETLTIGPDQRKAVTDVLFDFPSGFMGDTLNIEVQYTIDGRTEIGRSRGSFTRSAGFSGRLPFDGIWYVAAEHGHLDPHKRSVAEMFAYDFLQVGTNGKSYQRDGSRNTDFFAYGRKVLASKDGVVSMVRSDVPDNAPGTANPEAPRSGNVVVIDHGGGQYGYYAHLRPGSIPVKTGSRVRAGDILGEVGNSGDSREPHLHFHVMSGDNVDEADALPVVFENWKGQAHTRMPLAKEPGVLPRGEFVEP